MIEVTGQGAASTFTNGLQAALADAGTAAQENNANLQASTTIPTEPDQIVENSSDRDQDDYIVSYCMCLHEPSCARAEPVRNTEGSPQ